LAKGGAWTPSPKAWTVLSGIVGAGESGWPRFDVTGLALQVGSVLSEPPDLVCISRVLPVADAHQARIAPSDMGGVL